MFYKLISNLPFNPSLITNLSFYAKRLKQEEALRRIGFVFVALAMFIQMFAVMAPPEPTLAASANDIIYGGFKTRDEALLHCINPKSDFNSILASLGITCENLGKANIISIKSTDYGGELYSMGRHAKGPVGKNNKPTNEYPISINGTNFYMRKLNSFDSSSSSTYQALTGTTSDGRTFMILLNCGNPVLVGKYVPTKNPTPAPKPAPTPTPTPTPTPQDNSACEVTSILSNLLSGQKFSATIKLTNNGNTTWDPAKGYILGSQNPADNMNWGINRVSLPKAVAPNTSVSLTGSFIAPTKPGTYSFTWQMKNSTKWFGAVCASPINITEPEKPIVDVCPEIPGVQASEAECAPCDEAETNQDVSSCLSYAKTATNDTQSIANANNTTAQANDNITYTVSVSNRGKIAMSGFIFEEDLTDILEYADLVSHGNGVFDPQSKILKWPNTNIAPGSTESRTFSVKVKSTIPETPTSSSDPTSYDLKMTNVFHGSTVNIKLPPGPGKTTEEVVTTLPSTGPGTSVMIGFVLTTIVAYFFARSRLLNQELEIIKTDFAYAGGA